MSAEEIGKTGKAFRKLGIIAGGGALPALLAGACERQGIDVFIVALEGHADASAVQGRDHLRVALGHAGSAIAALKDRKIRDLVLIGSVRRPGWAELAPDLRTLKFLARVGTRALGDDGLLRVVRDELEREGFTLHGVQDFAGDLLTPAGVLGRHAPDAGQRTDITRGIAVSQALGALDVGQSAIVQGGIVLGVEGVEGTDDLIRRCAALHRKGRGGVLVKTCKPGQDRDLDLPMAGPQTVRLAVECGLSAIALHAGRSLSLERAEMIRIADAAGIALVGVAVGQEG